MSESVTPKGYAALVASILRSNVHTSESSRDGLARYEVIRLKRSWRSAGNISRVESQIFDSAWSSMRQTQKSIAFPPGALPLIGVRSRGVLLISSLVSARFVILSRLEMAAVKADKCDCHDDGAPSDKQRSASRQLLGN